MLKKEYIKKHKSNGFELEVMVGYSTFYNTRIWHINTERILMFSSELKMFLKMEQHI